MQVQMQAAGVRLTRGAPDPASGLASSSEPPQCGSAESHAEVGGTLTSERAQERVYRIDRVIRMTSGDLNYGVPS